jgi:aminoglycoside phosphotransferase (APT) family kinase protein
MTVHAETAGAVTLGDQLRRVLVAELADPDVQVRGLRRLTGGASRETWFFEATGTSGDARPLVLRRDPPGRPRADGMSIEAHAIASAARAGVPVPDVLAYGDDTERLEAPFMIMEWLAGETLARRILGEDQYRGLRERLAGECGDILARIHGIVPGDVPGLHSYDVVCDLRDQLDLYTEASPVFELALRWLDANRPDAGPTAVVHGDFRNGNLIVGPEGVRAVLDWEMVHLGDAMEDLGWLCVRAWRFGSDHPVGGFGGYEQLFDAYARRRGEPVDRDAVLWWEVLGTLKWGLGCMKMASEHLVGDVRSVERAAIGRRVREQEYDVLLLIEQRLRGL